MQANACIESDPSDYTEEEAEHIVRSELNGKKLSEREQRREFWGRLGFAQPIGLQDFLSTDYSVDFLVDRCLVRDSSCIIAGASKSLKTTISLHLALCLASGQKFLGNFETVQTPVMFASAESGAAVLQRNLKGMGDYAGLDFDDLHSTGSLSVQFWVPRISNDDLMAYFADCIDETGAKAVFLDPLYLSMDGESQSNLSLNGEQIQKLVMLILDKGATPIVNDHVKRSSGNARDYKPLQLEDISGAGKAENFRQWLLLGRRSRFQDGGDAQTRDHDLWLTAGGSAGHSSTWGLDVSERFSTHFDAVEYSMHLRPGNEVREESRSESDEARAEKKAQKEAEAEKAFVLKVERALLVFQGRPNELIVKNDIRASVRCSGDVASQILYRLEADGLVVKHPEKVRSGTLMTDAWKLPGELILPLSELDEQDGQTRLSPPCPPSVPRKG